MAINTATVSFRMVENFFDRDHIKSRIDYATRRKLGHAAGEVRKTAKRSIKRPGKRRTKRRTQKKYRRGGRDPTVSRRGSPPRQHTEGKRNLKLIIYAFDPHANETTVGPVEFRNAAGQRDVPGILEQGGSTKVAYRDKSGRRKTRPARVQPRPFMAPALSALSPRFPDLFKNSVK